MSLWRVVAIGAGFIVLLGAGVAIGLSMRDDGSTASGSTVSTQPGSTATTPGEDDGSGADASPAATTRPTQPAGCDLAPGAPYIEGSAVAVETVGEANGIQVRAGIYPRPDYEGNPWSQWGQGLALSDGRHISAIGDHIGRDGNSYVYEYDPATEMLTQIADVLSFVDHDPGSWGYGKVHGQVVPGPCGEVYLATYWGSRNDLEYAGTYSGDVLLRVDPASRTITDLGAPIEEHGIPSLAGSGNGLVFGEALDPYVEDDVDGGPFFAYDTATEEVIFTGPAGPHVGYRNIMIDGSGRAYYSMGGSQLSVYDPETNELSTHTSPLPGDWLRASTVPADDGRVFGVTDNENFFVMDAAGQIEGLGQADGYTTSLALDPDGSRFFYVPDAHGDAWEIGAPLISVDTTTGEQTTLVELNPIVEPALGLRLGGTYSLAMDPSGDRIFIGMNASADDSGFGEIVLLIVDLS